MEFSHMFSYLNLFASTFAAVFVIVDPFAMVGVYLSLTDGMVKQQKESICRKACFVAAGILISFALLGMSVFNLFGISMAAFQIAGGILLLLTGIDQLKAERSRVRPEEAKESMARDDISVFPLATPMLAGPGAISTVVLLSNDLKGKGEVMTLLLAIVVALIGCYVVLRAATYIFRFLGKTGLNLLTRIMGIMLTAISIQFIINGLEAVISKLRF